MIEINLSGSSVPKWMACPARADHEDRNPKERPLEMHKPIHVGTLAGHMVHNIITGHEYHAPPSVKWDEQTRSMEELTMQVKRMAQAVKEKLSDMSFEIVDTEVPLEGTVTFKEQGVVLRLRGHVDIQAVGPTGTEVLLDLKTGKRRPDGVWPQLATYAYLWQRCPGPADPEVTFESDQGDLFAGMLWVRRQRVPDSNAVSLEIRGGTTLANSIIPTLNMVAALASIGAPAFPSAIRCPGCPLVNECVVAAVAKEQLP